MENFKWKTEVYVLVGLAKITFKLKDLSERTKLKLINIDRLLRNVRSYMKNAT